MTDRYLPISEALDICRFTLAPLPTQQECGPNDWDNIAASDFGPDADYEIYDHHDTVVFWPVSNAALQWANKHLPKDCDRWHTKGFVVEVKNIDAVIAGAMRDNLMSEAEFGEAMNEAHMISLQGEA